MRMHHAIAVVLAVGITAHAAKSSALMTVPGTTGDNAIFVGVAQKPLDDDNWTDLTGTLGGHEPSGWQIYACVRGSTLGSTAHWYYLGNPLSALYDDTVVDGNSGNDSLEVIRSARYLAGTDSCDGLSYWFEAGQGDKYLDLRGGGGTDYLYGGDQNTWISGEAGTDTLYAYDTGGYLYGGTENDILISFASSEALDGDAGNDCVHDINQAYTSATGDTGTDTWVDSVDCSNTTAFETRRSSGSCLDEFYTDVSCSP